MTQTVKCITKHQKDYIVQVYKHKQMSIKEMAQHFERSPRTIGRVLDEFEIARPTARAKGEAYNVMKLLDKYHLNYATLKMMLERKHAHSV